MKHTWTAAYATARPVTLCIPWSSAFQLMVLRHVKHDQLRRNFLYRLYERPNREDNEQWGYNRYNLDMSLPWENILLRTNHGLHLLRHTHCHEGIWMTGIEKNKGQYLHREHLPWTHLCSIMLVGIANWIIDTGTYSGSASNSCKSESGHNNRAIFSCLNPRSLLFFDGLRWIEIDVIGDDQFEDICIFSTRIAACCRQLRWVINVTYYKIYARMLTYNLEEIFH